MKIRLDQAVRNLSAVGSGIDEFDNDFTDVDGRIAARELLKEARDAITDVEDSWDNG